MTAPSTPRLARRTIVLCVALAVVVASLAAVIAVGVLGDSGDGPGVDGQRLLRAPLTTRQGTRSDLRALRTHADRPLVVNLWAQSCLPCVAEMPLLERAHQRRRDLEFIGVNELDLLRRAEATARRRGVTYQWALDTDGSWGLAAGSAGIPETFLIDPDGTVRATKLGAFHSDAAFDRWAGVAS